jgi:hypothetical protein
MRPSRARLRFSLAISCTNAVFFPTIKFPHVSIFPCAIHSHLLFEIYKQHNQTTTSTPEYCNFRTLPHVPRMRVDASAASLSYLHPWRHSPAHQSQLSTFSPSNGVLYVRDLFPSCATFCTPTASSAAFRRADLKAQPFELT